VSRTLAWLLILVLLLGFWEIALRHLTITPPVYEDEPWLASSGWKLARDGVFGSDLFAGLNGMETRYYGYMPLHPLLLAGVFRGAGVGLFQARFETVCLGLLTLALTVSLAARLSRRQEVGLLAGLLLLTVRQTGRTPSQITGIVLLDVSRIARYDVLVPVFGLASLHAYLSARRSRAGYFLAGLLAGLAGLAHLYGLFYVALLALLVLWNERGKDWQRLGLLLLGAVLPWLPYGLYVLADLPAWQAQTAGYADRFGLLDVRWYLDNLLREPRRYGPGLEESGIPLFLRPGLWALALLPFLLLALWRRALRGDEMARVLVWPATGLPLLFALFITLKLSNYLVAIVPLWAIAGAWGSTIVWRYLRRPSRLHWARLALGALLLAILVEGASRWAALEASAAQTTPQPVFAARLRNHLPPPGTRVLGLHGYWFGLEAYDYRSLLVPVAQSRAPGTVTLAQALDRIGPQALLIDHHFRAFLDGDPAAAAQFEAWLARRRATMSARIDDQTYGPIEIYLIPPTPP